MHALVNDALEVLDACAEVEDPESDSALGLLALVAGRDVELDEQGRWHIVRGVAKDQVISVVDPETRHMHKSRSSYRDGYKAHLCVEPETGVITAAVLTPANAPDGPTGVELLDAGHHRAIKPHSIITAVPGGLNRDDFIVDESARTVTCPAGHTVSITATRKAVFGVRCANYPLRSQCTNSKSGRSLALTVHDAELVESRRAWRDGDFISDYRKYRPMVERSIA
jgi:hypothetical protein